MGPTDPEWGLTAAEAKGLSDWLMEPRRLEHAISLAAAAHAGQVDKAGQPYILHPLRVMLSGVVLPNVEDRIVAVLHDVVEDTSLTLDIVRTHFGATIAESVDVLTRRRYTDYDGYIQRIIESHDDVAVRVKMADLKDNMNMSRLPDPTERDYLRLTKYMKAARRLEREARWAFE